MVEVRAQAWGSWLIIGLNDAAGNQITRLCDAALDKKGIAVSLSDPSASSILATALMAKASGRTVSGWGIDQVQGNWCGIGNFAVYP